MHLVTMADVQFDNIKFSETKDKTILNLYLSKKMN